MSLSTEPFFIVGCDWSGIAELRTVLKRHENLLGPQPMSMYRWTEAFGVKSFQQAYLKSTSLKSGWRRDGVSYTEMQNILSGAASRLGFMRRYTNHLKSKQNNKGQRWFDASPRNVYGLLLIRAHFAKSKIVHVYRHPQDVVASLMFSPSASQLSLVAAVNHWLEVMQIINVYKLNKNHNLLELKFEEFLADPSGQTRQLLQNLGEDVEAFDYSVFSNVDQSKHAFWQKDKMYSSLLSQEDRDYISEHCAPFMEIYGYSAQGIDEVEKLSNIETTLSDHLLLD